MYLLNMVRQRCLVVLLAFHCSVNIPSRIVVLFNWELLLTNSLLSKAAFLVITWRFVRTSNLLALKSSFAVLQPANGSLVGTCRVLSLPGSEGLGRKHLTVISSSALIMRFDRSISYTWRFKPGKNAFRNLPPSKMLLTSQRLIARQSELFLSQLLAFSIHLHGV